VRPLDCKLWRDLAQMKGQVATIAVVVACGVAVFVASLATYDSLKWTQQSYYASARFAHIYAQVKRAPNALVQQLRALPMVTEVEPRVVSDVTLDVPGLRAPAVGRLIGVPSGGQPQLNRLYLRRGRLIEPGRANEVVISESFAIANQLQPGATLSAMLNGRREILQVVGVVLSAEYIFALRGGEALPDDRQFGVLWMEESALAAAFDMEGAFNNVILLLAPGASEQAVIDQLGRVLERYGGLGAYGRDQQVSHRFVSDEIYQQEMMATTMPPIFLGIAAFLLNIVLSRIVGAQREQIAALKALGYADLTIGMHYLKFVCVIVALGATGGVVLGAWLGHLMTVNYVQFFRFPILAFRLQVWVPVVAVGISLLAAVIAAFAAVRRVVQLAPAEAMRPPAPPRYQRSWIERLWLLRRLSAQDRMVLRNMVRRPWRTALTIIGIALAAPILVLALFWQDALEYMIAVQFFAIERGDVTVTFTDPVSKRAQSEIARLPGVLQTESSRVVPVRLRAGHRSYRTAIIGLPEQASLRRVLDANLRALPLPAEGLLLTDRLGERLGLRPGDVVRVETLEGTRVQRDVRVSQLVRDLVGMSAYMQVGTLNRLMSEDEVISAVTVSLDPREADAVYTQLKQLPKVATVSIKQAALRSFTETTMTFILVFTGIMMIFAVAIAVGVVYNNARVALSERTWELASLRVLGFTRAEVSAVLLYELAIELIVAIPLGLCLGYWMVVFISAHHQAEMFRIPPVIGARSYTIAASIIFVAGVISALIVRHRIDHLDLVSVLKTRE
jgi:putative ABC transport system permease protein